MMVTAAPIIVSALFAPEDFRWLDAQRRAHFPPERNVLAAHLTLFHHLPPSIEDELIARLRTTCRRPAPPAKIVRLFSLGNGVAYGIDSPALENVREKLAEAFGGLLTPQDQASWRPHVTIQNKVAPHEARALLERLRQNFRPRPLDLAGLAAWFYRGGPWEQIAAFRFGGGHAIPVGKTGTGW